MDRGRSAGIQVAGLTSNRHTGQKLLDRFTAAYVGRTAEFDFGHSVDDHAMSALRSTIFAGPLRAALCSLRRRRDAGQIFGAHFLAVSPHHLVGAVLLGSAAGKMQPKFFGDHVSVRGKPDTALGDIFDETEMFFCAVDRKQSGHPPEKSARRPAPFLKWGKHETGSAFSVS